MIRLLKALDCLCVAGGVDICMCVHKSGKRFKPNAQIGPMGSDLCGMICCYNEVPCPSVGYELNTINNSTSSGQVTITNNCTPDVPKKVGVYVFVDNYTGTCDL